MIGVENMFECPICEQIFLYMATRDNCIRQHKEDFERLKGEKDG